MPVELNLPSIIVGWLFGISSPLIIDKIKSYSKKRSLIKGMLSELDEVQFKLACTAYLLGERYGKFDREFLLWFKSIVSIYSGIENRKDLHSKNAEKLLKLSDQDLEFSVLTIRQKYKGVGLSMKTHRLTFISANINEISLFNIEQQRLLLDVNARLEMINEEIEASKKYHMMTFDSNITSQNYQRITQQIDNKYFDIQKMVIDVVDKISRLKTLTTA
jgi:hypothetical protein